MPELREDPLTGALVILAPGRAARPDTHHDTAGVNIGDRSRADIDTPVEGCPFCAGHEHMTPPEVARTGAGAPETPGWHVRVVPNLYPIVGDGVPGAHEVIVLSPSHRRTFGFLSDEAATEALTVLRDRSAFHLANGLVHAQPFINSGRAAGASIEHPHAQLVALAFVPPAVATATGRFGEAGTDLVARAIGDAAGGPRAVVAGDALAWCSPSSRSPFEVCVAVAGAGPRFDEATDAELAAVASVTRQVLRGVAEALDDPAYNVVFHTAAPSSGGPYHWWVRITPRVSVTAGFEEGTGILVNTVAPETAASTLRDAIGRTGS
jgi:UDPglucose--hexose-1-phosphate uridylyltransferase